MREKKYRNFKFVKLVFQYISMQNVCIYFKMINLGRIFECFNDEVFLDSLFMLNIGKMYNRY